MPSICSPQSTSLHTDSLLDRSSQCHLVGRVQQGCFTSVEGFGKGLRAYAVCLVFVEYRQLADIPDHFRGLLQSGTQGRGV